MKKRYWVIFPVVVVIGFIGILLFMYGYFPRPFFSGGKYRAVNQYEIFRDLFLIILTLAGLSIAVISMGVYQVLKGRVEDTARKEAKKSSAKVTRRLVLEIVKMAIEPARNSWRIANTLQNQKDKEPERKRLRNWSIKSLQDALIFAEDTLPVAQNKDFWQNPKQKGHFITLKNNLAFYMACRKDVVDRKDAREYASEIEEEAHSQSVPDYHCLDTAAWVFRQFALDDKDREKSEVLVLELTNREDIPDKDKKKLLDKYTEKPGNS